ncbi:MAG: DUF1674 domain-containing protein [Rhodospirillaceae bacterium]|nr:DUF1674 domain-containing protein [Rhodospirillaceae bacterium]
MSDIPAENKKTKPPNPGTVTDKRRQKKIPPGHLEEETGGPDGPEPTRYGDWEKKGRCIDF